MPASMKIGNVNVWDENAVKEWGEKYATLITKNKLDKRRVYGERTKAILRLTAEGLRSSEIATKLGTTTQIVGGYLNRPGKVFKATNREELVKKAIEKEII